MMTEALAIEILDQMVETGINIALRMKRVTVGDFFKFISRRADLMNIYLANQQTRAEVLADEIPEIADNELVLDRAKVKIAARQWFSSRILHRKYGDKLAVEHSGNVDIRGAISDARDRANRAIAVTSSSSAPTQLLDKPIVPAVEGYVLDSFGKNEMDRVNSLQQKPGEDLVEWGSRLVHDLPLSAQPIPIEDEDIDLELASLDDLLK